MPLASPQQITREATELAEQRRQARSEMERPFGTQASKPSSSTVHLYRGGPLDTESARAVGTALHAVLEKFDTAISAQAERLREHRALAQQVEKLNDSARLRADELLERFQNGQLFARLRRLGPNVARELPILALPTEGSACGYVSGAIDLLYRDPEHNELVIADYKTDHVEHSNQLDELQRSYTEQGRVYAEAVRAALALDTLPRFELWLLDLDQIVSVPL